MAEETYQGAFEIMQCMISIAWCDEKLDKREMEIISEYIVQFNLSKEQIYELCMMLLNPKPLQESAKLVSPNDRFFTFSQCYVMAIADGNLDFKEYKAIQELANLWEVSKQDVDRIQTMASEMYETQRLFQKGQIEVQDVIERIAHE